MLEELYQRLDFKEWHFGHFRIDKQVDRFRCHYVQVVPLLGEVARKSAD
jgi:hypothetical protein